MRPEKIDQDFDTVPYRQTTDTLDFTRWYKCTNVEILDTAARWTVDPGSCYRFIDAYKNRPHLEFIAATTDSELCSFIRSWGPPVLALMQPVDMCELSEIHAFQDELLWWAHFFSVVDKCKSRISENSRGELAWVLGLDFNPAREAAKGFITSHDNISSQPSEIENYVMTATVSEITDLLGRVVLYYRMPALTPMLAIGKEKCLPVLEGGYAFLGLRDALRWMLYQDTVQGRTIRFCAECPKVIPPRRKKFCSDPCAKRRNDRISARGVRERKRISLNPLG